MKKSLLFVFIHLFILSVSSQPLLEKSCNMFRSGDKLIKQQVEFSSPGAPGENLFWDFSRQELVNERYELSYQEEDSLILGLEHRTLYKYRLCGDSLLLSGYENPTTLMEYSRPEHLLTYPFYYQSRVNGHFYGCGGYSKRLHLLTMGTSSSCADAYGSISLPSGDTLNNVLRVHTTKKIIERMTPLALYTEADSCLISTDSIDCYLALDSVRIQLDTYRWYAEGYRYPVYETVESTIFKNQKPYKHFNTAFYYTPDEQFYSLENDPDNSEKRERMATDEEQPRNSRERNRSKGSGSNGSDAELPSTEDEVSYTLSLSDDNNQLNVDYQLSGQKDVTILLFDMQGRIMTKYPTVRREAGNYSQNIPLDGCQRGEYLLRITVNDQVLGEKIVKK